MPYAGEPPITFLAFAQRAEVAARDGRCELLERPAVTLDEILSVFQAERCRNRTPTIQAGAQS